MAARGGSPRALTPGPVNGDTATDYYAKYEFDWHLATTQAGRDAIAAVELALAEVPARTGQSLADLLTC